MNLGNKLTVFPITVSVTVVTKIYTLEKNIRKFSFLFEFLDNACGWHILHKS